MSKTKELNRICKELKKLEQGMIDKASENKTITHIELTDIQELIGLVRDLAVELCDD